MNTAMAEELRREVPARIERFKASLRASGVDGALLLHGIDLLYFSGTRQNGALWIPAGGEPALFVRKSVSRARAESPLPGVRPFPPGRELSSLMARCPRIGVCYDVTRISQLEWWRKHLPGHEFPDVSASVRELRSRKSPAELEVMRHGGRALSAAIAAIPSFLRAGMREIDVAAEIELRLRRAGNEGSPRLRAANMELFTGLVVSGEAAAEPGAFDGPVVGRGLSVASPVGPSERVIGVGDPVLVDYTAVFGGYILDMARVFVVGTLDAELGRALEVAIAIQDDIAPRLVPGEVAADLYDRAADRAEAEGLGAYFMGAGDDASRFVAHGIGMELDELPVLAPGFTDALLEGQVVALEPKFVFPGRGAVGVENTWAVTRAGGERLTPLPDGLVRIHP